MQDLGGFGIDFFWGMDVGLMEVSRILEIFAAPVFLFFVVEGFVIFCG